MSEIKQQKWMSSGYLQAAPTGGIDHEKGIIEGVSVCTAGEAKGHGVNLDSEFIQRVTELGSSKRNGLKARFGHPNMCSTALGTFIGRFKNFRQVGDQTKADLFLSNEAKNTPHGDLYSYVLGMAENEPDVFGTSIVFTPGRMYQRDADGSKVILSDEYAADDSQPIFVECEELQACDTVDDPAANEGLFSRFSQETVAGQITEFLDLNPTVWEAIQTNPAIVESLARYGDKMDEFVSRYSDYRTAQQQTYSCECIECGHQEQSAQHCTDLKCSECGGQMRRTDRPGPGQNSKGADMKTQDNSEELEQAKIIEPVIPEALEVEVEVETPAIETPAAEVPVDEPEPDDSEDDPEPESMSREQFVAVADEFGDDVASQVMRDGGTAEDAARIAYKQQKDENEKLRNRVAELESSGVGGKPAPVKELNEKKPLIKIQGR